MSGNFILIEIEFVGLSIYGLPFPNLIAKRWSVLLEILSRELLRGY